MTKTAEFTTARGAKIILSDDGRAVTVQINGGESLFARVETDKTLGLVVQTSRIDHARKVVQNITIPVPADAIAAVEQFRVQADKGSATLAFVDRLNAEANRRYSKH